MNAIDQIFGWLMIALGMAHCVTSFRVQPLSHLTVWLSGTAAAMIVGGFLNVSRARHGDGLTRAFSLIANWLILALAVGLAWPVRYRLLHQWQALGILVVIDLAFFEWPFICLGCAVVFLLALLLGLPVSPRSGVSIVCRGGRELGPLRG